jgi:hypothetical protein
LQNTPACSKFTRGGKDDVCEARRLRRIIRILHDDQIRALQRAANLGQVRHAGSRVRANDPDRTDLAAAQRFEHANGVVSRLGPNPARRKPPELLHLSSIVRVGDEPLPGKRMAHVAAVASSHRIRLAGETERPAAGLADLAHREVKVDDRIGSKSSRERLVHAHRPKRDQTF